MFSQIDHGSWPQTVIMCGIAGSIREMLHFSNNTCLSDLDLIAEVMVL